MSDDVKIQFTTHTELSGADKTENAIKRVTAATTVSTEANRENATVTKESGDVIAELGRRGSESRDVMEGLAQTMRGDVVGGMQGAAKAIYNVRAAITTVTGIFGIVIGVLTIVASKIREVFVEARENRLKKQAEETGVAFDATTMSVDRLNKAKAEAFQQRLQSIDDVAKSILDHIDRMEASAQKLDDINKAMELANVDANPSLSAEEKLNAKDEIQTRYKKQAEDRTQKNEDARLKAAREQAYAFNQQAGIAYFDKEAATRRYEAASGQSLLPQIAELRKQLEEAKAAHPGADVSIPQLDQLEARLSFTQSEPGKKRSDWAKSQLDQAEAADKAARDKARAAEKAAADLDIKISEDRKARGSVAGAESIADSRKYYQDLGEAKARDAAQREALINPSLQPEATNLANRANTGAKALLGREAAGGPSLGKNARQNLQLLVSATEAAQKDGTTNNELERILALVDSLQTLLLNPSKGLKDLGSRLGQLEARQKMVESQIKTSSSAAQ